MASTKRQHHRAQGFGTTGSDRASVTLAHLATLSPLDAVTAILTPADQITAAQLLQGAVTNFRQSFRPASGVMGIAEVVVWGEGKETGVDLELLTSPEKR